MFFRNQTFFVFGMSSSGRCAAKKLLSLGAKTYVYDDDKTERTQRVVAELVKDGAAEATAPLEAINSSDVIVVSPGVPIDNTLLVHAKKSGKRIIGELELGYIFTRAPIVAVTGTNGKTTTCSLISAMLSESGIKNALLGNYGAPLTINGESLGYGDVAVVEVSSFQLETVKDFCPHIAVVLNVRSDHLDRHYTRENYVYLKSRILSEMRESEYAVLNFDDETARSFGAGIKAKVVWFSVNSEVDGAYLKDGSAFWRGERIFDFSAYLPKGIHNEENALAAIAAAKLAGADNAAIESALRSFRGVRHRIEQIAEKNGIVYFNDSKATNVDSTLKAVAAMTRPTVVILGGKNKNQDYEPLFNALLPSVVRHAVLTGEEAPKLLAAAEKVGFKDVSLCTDFEAAVKLASLVARSGEAVLLSPATSSFDRFSDYEERGAEFERIVKGLI